MPDLTDAQLRDLLARDPYAGWRAFVDQYTPTLLSLIERAGISDHDEAMELYMRACRRVAADDCARLKRHEPVSGPLSFWLSGLMRKVAAEWIRARSRKRPALGLLELGEFERQVFELFYLSDQPPANICGILGVRLRRTVSLVEVLDALDAIDRVLTERHRRELLSFAARARLRSGADIELMDASVSARSAAVTRAFDSALSALPPEDAAIARLRYVQGLTRRDIHRALHLEHVPDERLAALKARVRELLSGAGQDEADARKAAAPGEAGE